MAEFVHEHVVEQILIGLDPNDLVRYKRVCKSWRSLITSPSFVSLHLNRSYNKDRCNNRLGHRRISIVMHPDCSNRHRIVGSSNGLVCISSITSYCHLIVGNPLTREVRQLMIPSWIDVLLCWGFGYDSSGDDYKVVVGTRKGENQICFQVLSLKSNVWRVIGDVKYRWCVVRDGILCNGALHWIVKDQNQKTLILSYDISTNEFKEIPQPKDARYGCIFIRYLGIVKGCLCVFGYSCVKNAWLMKKYNVKESWERLQCNHETKKDIVHILRLGLPKYADASKFCCALEHLYWEYMDAHVFVQSLVSPHVNTSLMLVEQKPHSALTVWSGDEGEWEEGRGKRAEVEGEREAGAKSGSTPRLVEMQEQNKEENGEEWEVEAGRTAAGVQEYHPVQFGTDSKSVGEAVDSEGHCPPLMREDPGPTGSSILMKEVIVYTFVMLLFAFFFLSLMFLV